MTPLPPQKKKKMAENFAYNVWVRHCIYTLFIYIQDVVADPGISKRGYSKRQGVWELPWSPRWVQGKALTRIQGTKLPESEEFVLVKGVGFFYLR
jgi:hypothetical protein